MIYLIEEGAKRWLSVQEVPNNLASESGRPRREEKSMEAAVVEEKGIPFKLSGVRCDR